jgi:serine/threonine protein kinase
MTGTDVDDTIGTVLAGRFRVTGLLGSGGMATVYLADDEALGRPVAVKVFRRDLADGDDLQRQQDEIQLLATLNHPGLVTLFDASTDDAGNAFLVMELVDGTDLHSRLRDGPLSPALVARIGGTLADALVYVHAKGVIHRDIKPGNILLPRPDEHHSGPAAKLADFGIARIVDGARLTATGKILGTATYFSPEQAL